MTKIYLIITTCVNPKVGIKWSDRRKQEYYLGIANVLNLAPKNFIPIIVENSCENSSYLDVFNCDIVYTKNNEFELSGDWIAHKGQNELRDIKYIIQKYNIEDDDIIIKMTGRYLLFKDDFFQLVQKSTDKEAFLRYYNVCTYETGNIHMVQGLFALKAKYFKIFEYRDFSKGCEEDFVSNINDFVSKDKIVSVQKIVPKPYKWIEHNEPGMGNQGPYYCSVGGGVCLGREISDKHLEMCLKAGLEICGTNAEVMASQWEYQIGPVPTIDGSDQLWISRYILHRLSEKYNYRIELDPKPIKGNEWNGSGMHVNFSTKTLREDKKNKKQIAEEMCKKLEKTHTEHINLYGINNEQRLTGFNETASIKKFTYNIGDRSTSVRIPYTINNPNAIGYIEDRRPASNGDPYLIVRRIVRTLCKNEINKYAEV